MKKILLIFLFLFGNCLFAQQIIPADSLISDLKYFFKTIEETHPDPYTPFGGKMQFHKSAQRLQNDIPATGLDLDDFHFLISGFISELHDGHTYISKINNDNSKSEERCLALRFSITSDEIFVKESQAECMDLLGYRIKDINNIPFQMLLEKIQIFEPCENLFGARYFLINYVENFSKAKRLFPKINEKLSITFISNNSEQISREIPFILKTDKNKWESLPKWQKIKQSRPCLFSSQFIDEEKKVMLFNFNATYAREVLEMEKTWNMDTKRDLDMIYNNYLQGIKQPEDFDSALKNIPSLTETTLNMLNEMKANKAKYLIIDLSKNTGGWTPITIPVLYLIYGDKYFSYNNKSELNRLISEQYLKKYNLTIDQYNKNNNTSYKIGNYIFSRFYGQNDSLEPRQRREKYLDNESKFSWSKILKNLDGKPVYTPKIIVLTSSTTFSAAYHFMYLLKEVGNAVIVGVPPRQAGNSGMETTQFTLPNTKISGSISCSYQILFPNDKERGTTFWPDYVLKWEDYKKYKFDLFSPVLFVFDLITQGKI